MSAWTKFRAWFCGRSAMTEAEAEARSELAPKLREAAHRVANAAMEHHHTAERVQREANAFLSLVEAMKADAKKRERFDNDFG